jgi:ABC-2 type transport system ATP-binding protein
MSENVIELAAVSKTFRDFWLRPTVKAVDGLSLTVRKGEVFGLLGPNGSGKSTTIKMILGLLAPSAGEVKLFSMPPQSSAARAKLGYLPELSYLHPFLTAAETVRYYAGLCALSRKEAKRRAAELLEMVGLAAVAGRPVGGFSKGMARRVALAASLVGKPELLVLDEPTSGLDPISTKEVKTLIRALADGGMTILTTAIFWPTPRTSATG